MTPVKTLIVEDELLIAEHIKDLLNSFGITDISMADSKETAMQAIDELEPELILLDMNLENEMDGLELAKYIDEKYSTPYVFITANSDILVIKEAVLTNAAAYITKPIKSSDLFAALKIAVKSNLESRYLLVKNEGSTLRLPVSEIMYIESNGNYIHIFNKKGKTLSRQSLDWAEEQLPKNLFLRVHRSFLVNANFVSKINAKSLYIEETEIPISRIVTSEVMNYFKTI